MMNMRKMLVITALVASLATLGADRAAAQDGIAGIVCDKALDDSDLEHSQDSAVSIGLQAIHLEDRDVPCEGKSLMATIPTSLPDAMWGDMSIMIQLNSSSITSARESVAFTYDASLVSEFEIDGVPRASKYSFPATTADAFSHRVQFDYDGKTFEFEVVKDANSDTLKAFTIEAVAVPPPTITSVSPHAGPAEGSTTVTIEGTGFTGATLVTFGDVDIDADSFTVNDDGTAITVTTPSGTAGIVQLVVTAPGGTAEPPVFGFAYLAITSITPNRGPTGGDTTVTITINLIRDELDFRVITFDGEPGTYIPGGPGKSNF